MSTPTRKQADAWTIYRAEVGSRVLGVSLEGTDDRDLLAIAVEPPEWVVGIRSPVGEPRAWQYRTKADGTPQPDGARSGPGDEDLAVHPLRKWIRLALGGNPTVLISLFSPRPEVCRGPGDVLRTAGPRFVSERARAAFGGYLEQQRRGLTGEAKTKTNRPELVAVHGYDTKYAYHALRLGWQGVEFLTYGELTLPMRDEQREVLLSVRRGEIPLREVVRMIDDAAHDLARVVRVPDNPDTPWADRFVTHAYLHAWRVDGR